MDLMDDNGLWLFGKFLPYEIILNILNQMEPTDLLNCRQVCQLWCKIINNELWKFKFFGAGTKYKSFSNMTHSQFRKLSFPWFVCYKIFVHDPFERNLVKNNCGQDGTENWIGDKRIRAVNAADLPKCDELTSTKIKHCLVIDEPKWYPPFFGQHIYFQNFGIWYLLWDELNPKITISIWASLKQIGTCEFTLRVNLTGITNRYKEKTIILSENWQKVELVIENHRLKKLELIELIIRTSDIPENGLYVTGSEIKLSLSSVSHFTWDELMNKEYWLSKRSYDNKNEMKILRKLIWTMPVFPWFEVERLLLKRPFRENMYISSNNLVVDLHAYGLYSTLIDNLQPVIMVDVTYPEGVVAYALKIYTPDDVHPWTSPSPVSVCLLNSNEEVLLTKTVSVSLIDGVFRPGRIKWLLEKYGPGVRYIKIVVDHDLLIINDRFDLREEYLMKEIYILTKDCCLNL